MTSREIDDGAAWSASTDSVGMQYSPSRGKIMTPLQGHTDLIAGPEDTGFTPGATKRIDALLEVLHEGRRAIGDHWAPNDCYATGPMTGDPIRDLVQCPACSFIAMYEAAISQTRGTQP